jgi:hypothetical protein
VIGLSRSPESLAYLLEATGKVGLERRRHSSHRLAVRVEDVPDGLDHIA